MEETEIRKENYPVSGEYIENKDIWLANDAKEPRKQRHTIQKIYSRLVKEKGLKETTVVLKKVDLMIIDEVG